MLPISTFILISKVIWPPIALTCAWHHSTFYMCSCLCMGLFKNTIDTKMYLKNVVFFKSPSMCDEGPSILGNFLFFSSCECVSACVSVVTYNKYEKVGGRKTNVKSFQTLHAFAHCAVQFFWLNHVNDCSFIIWFRGDIFLLQLQWMAFVTTP